MFIAESTPSTITGHADTFALILTLVIGFRFNVIEYTSIDPETNTTVTVQKRCLKIFFRWGFSIPWVLPLTAWAREKRQNYVRFFLTAWDLACMI